MCWKCRTDGSDGSTDRHPGADGTPDGDGPPEVTDGRTAATDEDTADGNGTGEATGGAARSLRRRGLLAAAGTALAGTGLGGVAAAHEPWERNPYAHEFDSAYSANYTDGSRRAHDINWIVCHVTVGSFSSAVNWFKDPDNPYNTSAHYVIRHDDGYCKQMVRDEDVAHHAAGFNGQSIGIEHEWYEGLGEVSDAAMDRSAKIVRHVAEEYDIPLEYYTDPHAAVEAGGGIIGHANAPKYGDPHNTSSKTCPQPGWNWDRYAAHLGGSSGDGGDGGSNDPSYGDGDYVRSTVDLNTREQPGLDSPVVDTMPTGATAEVVNGPTEKDGYVWWGLHWVDHGVWGWSVDKYLEFETGGGGGTGGYDWPLYSYGDRGESVYTVQYLLEQHGHDLEYHDGVYGTEVKRNVEWFQDARGLAVDGIVGPNTWEHLQVYVRSADDDPWWATYAAQHHLRYDEGYDIAVDGYYGPETEWAIEDFQRHTGITVDGIVGPETWRALLNH